MVHKMLTLWIGGIERVCDMKNLMVFIQAYVGVHMMQKSKYVSIKKVSNVDQDTIPIFFFDAPHIKWYGTYYSVHSHWKIFNVHAEEDWFVVKICFLFVQDIPGFLWFNFN